MKRFRSEGRRNYHDRRTDMEKKVYIIGTIGSERWTNLDEFDSVEEAVSALDTGNYDGEEAWDDADSRLECAAIGLKKEIDPTASIDGDDIIYRMAEHAQEECGEVAEDFLDSVHEDAVVELTEELRKVAESWLRKNNLWPTFYQVEEVTTYKEAKAKTVKAT
jgi:hypothetical protein